MRDAIFWTLALMTAIVLLAGIANWIGNPPVPSPATFDCTDDPVYTTKECE